MLSLPTRRSSWMYRISRTRPVRSANESAAGLGRRHRKGGIVGRPIRPADPTARPYRPATVFDFRWPLARGRAHARAGEVLGLRTVCASGESFPAARTNARRFPRHAAEHALDVRRKGAVAAEQAMPPEQPQIARLRHRLLGHRRRVVGIR